MNFPAHLPHAPTVAQLWDSMTRGTRATTSDHRDFFYAGVVYAMAALLDTLYDDQCTPEDLSAYTLRLEAELKTWMNGVTPFDATSR